MKLKKIYQFLLQKTWEKPPLTLEIIKTYAFIPKKDLTSIKIIKNPSLYFLRFEKEVFSKDYLLIKNFKYDRLDILNKLILFDKESILIDLFFLNPIFFCLRLFKDYCLEKYALEIESKKYTLEISKSFYFPSSAVYFNFSYFFTVYLLILILIKK